MPKRGLTFHPGTCGQLLLLCLCHSARLCTLIKYALKKMPLGTVIDSPTPLDNCERFKQHLS